MKRDEDLIAGLRALALVARVLEARACGNDEEACARALADATASAIPEGLPRDAKQRVRSLARIYRAVRLVLEMLDAFTCADAGAHGKGDA